MLVPEQLEARAAGLERCAEAFSELAHTVCLRAEDIDRIQHALKECRLRLNATWQGLAQVGFDDEWETVATGTKCAVSRLYDEAHEMGCECSRLHNQAAELCREAARIRHQQEEERLARERAAA